MDGIKESFYEHLRMVVDLILDAFVIIIAMVLFYIINIIAQYLGFEHEIFYQLLTNYVHPIIIAVFFIIFIFNTFMKFLPNPSGKQRYRFVSEPEAIPETLLLEDNEH